MISRLRGTLLSHRGGSVEVATRSGVVYEVDVPLSVAERLPGQGEELELLTVQVVRENLIALFGFLDPGERALFQVLLEASGVGARLALAMLSTLPAPRLARAVVERDVPALVQAPGVGRKTAERLVVELEDRVKRLEMADASPLPEADGGARDALHALVSLGLSPQEAERAIRAALAEDPELETEALIRRALALK